ncbi:hypothetical protein F4813DRAFT_173593 [Daldinia decipiens]|uniref:uncharacterized protein n=1 Tax=Daldinia decipiens TaxID=326647 RepID=UPI0020C28297|nr:uncharacterized protein F4813DRAFT_173593 [Daldinia decipiens]KAI1661808.1 hypothetical protein F4813DRAFT_173593 [Daldinia decipiens]
MAQDSITSPGPSVFPYPAVTLVARDSGGSSLSVSLEGRRCSTAPLSTVVRCGLTEGFGGGSYDDAWTRERCSCVWASSLPVLLLFLFFCLSVCLSVYLALSELDSLRYIIGTCLTQLVPTTTANQLKTYSTLSIYIYIYRYLIYIYMCQRPHACELVRT